ncbi:MULTISPECIES: hypothetical protein [unclassified Luteococcus]|uniref:hypothetical protein n=1 Tax=unclassified Luteococcus TaxID=2639923 RepID=UPI00313CA8A1
MNKTLLPLAAVLALAAPAVATAPGPAPGSRGTSIDELVAECRASGLSGWDLVDEATRRVHEAFDHISLWHLWEGSATALRHGHGWSAQYNGALKHVLRRLGFRVEVVHAARVHHLGRNPWWNAGHTWLRVTHDGRTLDVCCSRAQHRAGQVSFVPVTQVRPMNRWTRSVVSLSLAPVVSVQAWRQLAGAPVPKWLYRGFDEDL